MLTAGPSTGLPVLLPQYAIPKPSKSLKEWTPSKYRLPPQPPPIDEQLDREQELAAMRQMADGKAIKKTRPRRTVDYGGAMGRWIMMKRMRCHATYVPYTRPAVPYVIDLLPPKAYPSNPSTSLCTKFIHTSTNKIRCPINVVTWTPESRRILTGSTSGEFTLWNGLTFNFETILQAHDSAIRAMKFTHSGAYLVSADQTGVIKYFQPNMNNLTAWNAHREAIRGLSFSPNDARFATASDDSTIRIWSFEESREERVLTGHGWDVKCVEWHPSKGLLVSGSKDNLVKFWDPRTGTCLSTLHQHKNTIQALAWSPNGDFVASASRDQTVRVFDIRAMKEFRVLKGHKKEVCSIAWHPVHPILVSGGSEGAILHWDLSAAPPPPTSLFPQTGPRATLSEAHDSNVWALTFHPLGHLLVSGSNDHTTRFWARERPGDEAGFSAGGEKPPEEMGGDDEDEDDIMVPGFSYASAGPSGPASGPGGQWWGKTDDDNTPVPNLGAPGINVVPGLSNGLPGLGVANFNPPSGAATVTSSAMDTGDDFIPGFGMAASQVVPRQSGPLPSQQDIYDSHPPPFPGREQQEWSSGGNGRGGQWNADARYGNSGYGPGGGGPGGGGGNRGGRWGPRRGGAPGGGGGRDRY